jgi:hypothetical protein
MEIDLCPNCVSPWKCNGPHLAKKDEGWYSCDFGNFYNIFGNHWEFNPNKKPMGEDDLMEAIETLRVLKMDPLQKKLHGIIMDHMYACIEEGMGIKKWIDYLDSLGVAVHTTLGELIRSSIGMGGQRILPTDPNKITVEANFGHITMSEEVAEKIMVLGYIPLPETSDDQN